jgi:hypothetical protein
METIRDTFGSRISQFSLFMANKSGQLLELTNLLSKHHINIVAITILDTADTATVRIILDDPDLARSIFQEHFLPFTETPIIAVELPKGPESLRDVLRVLWQAECNIFFTYSFITQPQNKPILAIHLDDEEIACNVLRQHHFKLLTQEDISR